MCLPCSHTHVCWHVQLCDFGLARGLEGCHADAFNDHNPRASTAKPSPGAHEPLVRGLTKHVVTRWYR